MCSYLLIIVVCTSRFIVVVAAIASFYTHFHCPRYHLITVCSLTYAVCIPILVAVFAFILLAVRNLIMILLAVCAPAFGLSALSTLSLYLLPAPLLVWLPTTSLLLPVSILRLQEIGKAVTSLDKFVFCSFFVPILGHLAREGSIYTLTVSWSQKRVLCTHARIQFEKAF